MHKFTRFLVQQAVAPVQRLADTAQAQADTAQATIAGQELQLQLAGLDMQALGQQISTLRTQLSEANTKLVQAQAQTAAVNGKVVTLQELSTDYQGQLQKSLDDRANLHRDLETVQQAYAALQTSYNTLQTNYTALQGRVRVQTVAIPAMALGASQQVKVTLNPGFADASYVVSALPSVAANLIGLTWVLLPGQTKTEFTIVLKNAGLLALAANAGTLHLLVTHT